MKGSKLIELLESFSAGDLRRLGEFLDSPLFNKRQDLRDFYAALRLEAPGFREERVDKYRLWAEAFPGQPVDEKALAYTMSGLLKLAEQYLGIYHYLEKPHLAGLHIAEATESRNLEKSYRQRVRQLQKELDTSGVRDGWHAYTRFRFHELQAIHVHRTQPRTPDQHLVDSVRYLDEFYLIAKLRMTCLLVNRQNILSADYDAAAVEALNLLVSQFPVGESPVVGLYYQLLKMLTEEDQDAHYREFRRLLDQHWDRVEMREQNELFSYAQNYCIRRWRKGHGEYLKELFSLYQFALESGILLEGDTLSPAKYKNIASVGIRLEQYEWVARFIERYRELLPAGVQETAYAYNIAFLQYAQGQYRDALKSLMAVEFTDVFYSLDTRKMMCMIYFMTNDQEPLLSLISAFRTYLRRNSLISDSNRQAYSNFLTVLAALVKAEGHAAELQAIREMIANTKPLVEESWLLEQTTGQKTLF